jgi:hypothetical protein
MTFSLRRVILVNHANRFACQDVQPDKLRGGSFGLRVPALLTTLGYSSSRSCDKKSSLPTARLAHMTAAYLTTQRYRS